MIVRGTTPTIRFNFTNIDSSDIYVAYMTIAQNNSVVLEKDISQATLGDGFIEFSLTQEDTLLLDEKVIASVQLRCKNNLGDAYDNLDQAYSKYHAVLSAAAVSSVPYHAAVLLDRAGIQLAQWCFEHIEQ